MRKKITLLFGTLALAMMVSCGPSKKDAVAYNDKIMALINNLSATHQGFLSQIDGHNIDSLKMTQQEFSAKSKASLEDANKVGPFAEKTEFIDATIAYFKTINSIADNEGKQMVDIMAKDSTQLTMEDVEKVEALGAKFDADYGKAFDMVQEAQSKFAKEWKFEIATH